VSWQFGLNEGETSLNEKVAIEKATADDFVDLYNVEMGSSFLDARFTK
jgi:hypothetical protein